MESGDSLKLLFAVEPENVCYRFSIPLNFGRVVDRAAREIMDLK